MAESSSPGLRTRIVHVGSEAFHLVEHGPASGPCVIFAHSIMTTHAMWHRQIELLGNSGYRAMAYDGRGHGHSVVSPAPYTLGQLTDDLVGLLDALHVERAHVVGLSLGGMIGFDLICRFAQRIMSAVICNARADSPASFAQAWDERIGLAQAQGMQALAWPTLTRWTGAGFRDSQDALALHQQIVDTPVQGFVGTARALQDFDFLDGLPQVDVPVTLICGEHDGVLPAEMTRLSGVIRHSVLELIPDAGHLPTAENPAAFDAALLRHFARITSG